MSWWEYASGTKRALIVIGVIAIALLAVVLVSPYVKPLQPIAKALGLMRTETVYVNKTTGVVYVNKTAVTYTNSTTQVSVVSYYPAYNGTCNIYSLVMPNGTVWTIGYWLPADGEWLGLYRSGALKNYTLPHGYQLDAPGGTMAIYVNFSGVGGAIMRGVHFTINMPSTPQPNWTIIAYIGDIYGYGPTMFEDGDYWGVDNGLEVQVAGFTLTVNKTYPAALTFTNGYRLYCNWTFIGPVNPEVALRLPAPMGNLFNVELHYVWFGNYTAKPMTWGDWVWREVTHTYYEPINVTNLPWPTG